MKQRVWMALLAIALITALTITGCGAPEAPVDENPKVNLDTPFELPAGKTASLLSEPLEVTFVNVTEDSRCPTGVQCFWAGQAIITIKVAPTGGGPGTVPLTLGGSKAGMDKASFGLFDVQLSGLAPIPNADAATNPNDYVATLVITKK